MRNERDLVGVAIGCPRCPRGLTNSGRTLVLSRCRECERNVNTLTGVGDPGGSLERAGWQCVAGYMLSYLADHGLPHLIVTLRDQEQRVFTPGWLSVLLTQGNLQRRRSDTNVSERLDWPKVLVRARDDADFRESLMGSIGLCGDPGSVFALVSSLDESLVLPPNIIIPRKRRTHTARSRA